MSDHLSRAKRSENMRRIRRSGSKPERIVRSALHAMGLRFRVDVRKLPGSPGIYLSRYGVAVFVHGCFWHRHRDCAKATIPKSNRDYWLAKFESNVARDASSEKKMEELEITPIVVWECQVKDDFEATLIAFLNRLGIEKSGSAVRRAAEKARRIHRTKNTSL